MAVYAIGDLHLSFQTQKPMDVFGEEWIGYEDTQIGRASCRERV